MSPVLANSSLLIQNGCTTAYEAVLNDIPVISYQPFEHQPHGEPANKLGKK